MVMYENVLVLRKGYLEVKGIMNCNLLSKCSEKKFACAHAYVKKIRKQICLT